MPEFNASVPLSVAFGAALGLGTALAAIQLVERRAKSHGDQSFCSQPPEITRDVRTGSMSSTGSSRPLFPITPRRASQSKKVASPRIESAIKGAPLPGKVSAMADNAVVEKDQELSNSSSGSSLQRVDSDANLVEMKQADLLRHLEHANGAHQPLVVGVAGGTGSGKTTLAKAIRESLELDCVSYVNHDNYYKVRPCCRRSSKCSAFVCMIVLFKLLFGRRNDSKNQFKQPRDPFTPSFNRNVPKKRKGRGG